MRRELAALGLAVVLVSTAFGASAFTSAQVDRSASLDVVTDDEAILALGDGTAGDIVENSSGRLTLDAANGVSAEGLNQNATFTIGQPDNSPSNNHAFTVTNQASQAHTVTFDFADPDGNSVANLNFTVFSSSDTKLVSFSEESSSVQIDSTDFSSGTTLYVTVTIDTHGLTESADLSGTLHITL